MQTRISTLISSMLSINRRKVPESSPIHVTQNKIESNQVLGITSSYQKLFNHLFDENVDNITLSCWHDFSLS